jgi:hypothetical protein
VIAKKSAKPQILKTKTTATTSAPAPGLRERKRRQTRDRLTKVAMELFLARGFEATTLDDIAAAAEISRRSFFHYFASKEDVVLAWQHGCADHGNRRAPGGGIDAVGRGKCNPDNGPAVQAGRSDRPGLLETRQSNFAGA